MNVLVWNGTCHFVDNLFGWAKSFHDGRKFYSNIAWDAKKFLTLNGLSFKNINLEFWHPQE